MNNMVFKDKKKHPLFGRTRLYYLVFGLISFIAISCHSLKVEKSEFSNIRLDSTLTVVPDSGIEAIIKPYREKLDADMNEVLCQSSEALFGGRPESPLTNYCADLVLEESNIFLEQKNPSAKIDVALVNRGGLRVALPKGNITVKTMFELMPFENEIVFLKLKSDLMLQFVNHLASRGGEGVAGLRFGIKDLKAVAPEINGNPIDPERDYWLSTSDYIANGGDGSEILTKVTERIDTGIRVRDMFIGHFRKLGKENRVVEAKKDGRIYDVE
jgi:2',3'-cyclic-nucleotide 2'-phosphodiesterase (5'-nucleotidase family)